MVYLCPPRIASNVVMPRLSLPDKSECLHNNIHAKWINQEGTFAVCRMAKPHLINSIKLLEKTLTEIYPLCNTAGRLAPVHAKEIAQTEYDLQILKAELDRRLYWR